MPIKFRCNYCRQFLGISRAQAGGIVDCPTCGRSIRVPLLDGTLQPLPEPELNLQDAHLARALDELARLAAGDSQPVPQSPIADVDIDDDAENEIPQPIPEPIPIEVPIPPTPIAMNPPVQEDESADAPPAAAAFGDRTVARPAASLLAELASLTPPPAEAGAPRMETPSVPPPVRPRSAPTSAPFVSVMIALAFVAGMLFERFVKVLESIQSAPPPVTPADDAAPEPASPLTGRITYKSADGTSQPDRGARILAFPPQRVGQALLPVVGFRPADDDADARLAAAALKALGGGLATADEKGQFQLDVPAGTYQLLTLSHFQPRDDAQTIDPEVRKVLAEYFDKPDELLGRVKFHFVPLKIKGTGDVWDHSF